MTSPATRSEASPSAATVTALPACPVCGGETWLPPRPRTQLRPCPRCGTHLNDRSRTREEEESRYTHGDRGQLSGEEVIAAAQWRWLTSTVGQSHQRAPLSVLDIGCGRGAFLRVARDAGVRVMGVELDPTGADACRAAGIPVVQGSLFDAGPPPGPWDVITLWDVLDHLEDPAGALRLLMPALAPGGVLVVRGRNARFHVPLKVIYTRARGFATRMRLPDVSTVHRWGFTPQGYRTLLERSGLDAVRLHPGLPTPGDRYGILGPRLLSAFLKGAIRTAGTALYAASFRHLYPFPSVLVSAHRA